MEDRTDKILWFLLFACLGGGLSCSIIVAVLTCPFLELDGVSFGGIPLR